MTERHVRSVFKGMTWRIIATMTTTLLVYIFTGSLVLAAEIGVLEVTLKLMFYYAHERAWNVTSWGIKDDSRPAAAAA